MATLSGVRTQILFSLTGLTGSSGACQVLRRSSAMQGALGEALGLASLLPDLGPPVGAWEGFSRKNNTPTEGGVVPLVPFVEGV